MRNVANSIRHLCRYSNEEHFQHHKRYKIGKYKGKLQRKGGLCGETESLISNIQLFCLRDYDF